MKHRYSTISLFHKCQQLYKLTQIDGLDDGSDKSGDLTFGTAVHMGVEDLLKGGNGVDVFEMFWSLQEGKELEYGRLGHDTLAELGKALLQVFSEEHLRHFTPKHIEAKAEAQLGDYTFSGTVDFLGDYKGVPSVVDWKTSAMPYDNYKIQCNEQMYGYAFLAEQALGFKAEQVVYGVAVKDPKNPRWQFKTSALSPDKQKAMLDNLVLTMKQIEVAKGAGFVKNAQHCVRGRYVCPFFDLCHKSPTKA